MKFFHYSAGTVSRSSGRSCVQAVAYITRSELYESRRGISANYTYARDHDVSWETMAPEGSGIGKKDLSIWDKADLSEDVILTERHKDIEVRENKINSARPAYDDEFSLPKELTREQNTDLVREYVNEQFISKGLIATWAIHWEEGNPHVHILYSARPLVDKEFSKSKSISRDLRGPGGVRGLREVAANVINKHQELAGLEDRVDPRSYAMRGIELIPTRHKGWTAHQMERDGLDSKIVADNKQITAENKERIAAEPGIILKELTSTQATFSQNDVMKLVQNRLKDDMGLLGEHVFHAVMNEAVEVGKNIHEQVRYTSQEYADKEAKVLECFEVFQANKASIKIDPNKVEELIGTLQEQGKEKGFMPNEGQINAIRTLCGDSQLSIMIGRAGTGKTTTMKSVVKLHEDAGFTVIGMAPSATAATQLEADTGCKSDTIAHYAYYWNKYDEAINLLHAATTDGEMKVAQKAIDKYAAHLPNSNTLIIIDEAGMIGVGDHKGAIPGGWDALTRTIDSTGAKFTLTGDDHQFKPIDGGDVFRRQVHELKGIGQFCELTEIMRQRVPWMKEASGHLAELNVATALGMYENKGHLKEHASNAEVYKDMAQQYFHNVTAHPDSTGMVIAATNEERIALNKEIRSILKENGLLPKEDILKRGEDGYTVGDKIVFTKNDRGWNTSFESEKEGFFVQNNMQAVIQSIKPVLIKDEKTGKITKTHEIVANTFDDQKKVLATITFKLSEYRDFSHSYATTGWKSQAKTLDWVIAKLSKYMDAYALYVILTRHRNNAWMHYSKEDFPDYKSLVHSLSRANVKDLVVDYSVSDENKEYWQNVQDYKETGRELQGIRALARSLRGSTSNKESTLNDKGNKAEIEAVWANHREVEADRKSWAKHILGDWEVHRDFVRQAGLTKESLEIAAGLKKRSLSRVEIEAQLTVEQYVSVSLEARTLWRDIRRTHPGSRAKLHPEWPKFEDARDQRGVLANQIHLNPILHRPFLKETAEQLAKGTRAGTEGRHPAEGRFHTHIGYVAKDNKISSGTSAYSMSTIRVQAEAHQSKMLQAQLLNDTSHPAQQDMLKVLVSYTENRDMAGAIWQEVRPKLKAFEGTLLKESFSKAISEYTEIRMKRDAAAFQIVERQEAFTELADKVGMKLDFEKLGEQAVQATRDKLLKIYQSSPEEMTKLQAAHDLSSLIKGEADFEKKPTLSFIYQQGLQPKDIAKDALEYQKIKLFESLKTEPERALFLLLDEYDAKCRAANKIYGQCIEEIKGKDKNPWESSHYPAYKTACNARNDIALEVFEQRDHGQVLAMAEAMGMRFKETELQEIFSRCEQATRTNNIISYLKAEQVDVKGQAAATLNQMITIERKNNGGASITAQQAYHAGIDFKELQKTALVHGRAALKQSLTSETDIHLFHALTTYEKASLDVKEAYKGCIEESKTRSTPDLAVKPWETKKYKDYISLVTAQDEHAHQLIKGHNASSLTRVAKEMGISVAGIDVEAHRHSLRQTLQIFTDGDRTNIPMAAREILNWIEFDRHSDHKHTFKILREQDLWPKDIREGLQEFFEKKKECRQETQRNLKEAARGKTQGHNINKPEYKIITYERYQSFEEIDTQLKERMFELATAVLGNPTSRTSNQLRFGKKGSISVFTNGPKQGLYANHETGIYGGPLKLIEEQAGLSSAKDSLKWASEWLGGNPLVIEQRVVEKQQNEAKFSTWTPITPVPKEVGVPDIEGNKYLNYMLQDGAKETNRHAYRDEQGNLKGFVFRIEKADGSKITPPLAYCENEKGFKAWKWQAFEKENKTPYGLEKLAQYPTKPILVVEGEKTADATQNLLPEYNVLTWSGGAGNVGKTNWTCLAGREVVIWPDNDSGGIKAAETLQKIGYSVNTESGLDASVGIVSLSHDLPEKWDLADKLPEGWTLDTVKEMIQKELSQRTLSLTENNQQLENKQIKARNIQFESIRSYLKSEITFEKHTWLNDSFINKVFELAKTDPFAALNKWQDMSGDFSFEPPIPDALLTPQQKEINQKILSYLHVSVQPDKMKLIQERDCQTILELAKANPQKALQEWQILSQDYNFNPFASHLNEREINVYKYIVEKITDEFSAPSKTIQRGVTNDLLSNPLKAYEAWQSYFTDQTFDPKTGIPTLETKAQELINSLGNEIPKDMIKSWVDSLIKNPDLVIKQVNDFMQAQDEQNKLDKVVNQFVSLSEQHEKLSYKDPKIKEIEASLKDITSKYIKDERFLQRIEMSNSAIACDRIAQEVKTPKPQRSRNSFEMER